MTNPTDLLAMPTTPVQPSNLHEVTSVEHFEELAKAAQGQVVVDFVQNDCEACEEEDGALKALAERCTTTTVLKINVDKTPELAERLKLWDKYDGTPTLLVAKSGGDLLRGKGLKEADPTDPKDRVLRRIKCAGPGSK